MSCCLPTLHQPRRALQGERGLYAGRYSQQGALPGPTAPSLPQCSPKPCQNHTAGGAAVGLGAACSRTQHSKSPRDTVGGENTHRPPAAHETRIKPRMKQVEPLCLAHLIPCSHRMWGQEHPWVSQTHAGSRCRAACSPATTCSTHSPAALPHPSSPTPALHCRDPATPAMPRGGPRASAPWAGWEGAVQPQHRRLSQGVSTLPPRPAAWGAPGLGGMLGNRGGTETRRSPLGWTPSKAQTLTVGQADPRDGLLRRREHQRRQHRVRQDRKSVV